jgi:trk system potassium uptake protein TrkA
MFVIVVGCGKIGYHLTRALLSSNHEVVVVERDSRRADAATGEFGSIVVSSDGTEPTVLREAGANRCEMLISTTGSDATNLVACQVARSSFDVPSSIAVVTDPDHVPLFKSLGINVTISTTELILSHIEEELPGGPLIHVLPLSGASSGIVCVRVPQGSPAVGRTLDGVGLPAGTALAAVVAKNGELRPVVGGLQLEVGDEIVAITPPEKEDQLWKALTGGG